MLSFTQNDVDIEHCPRCRSVGLPKIDKEGLREIMSRFFVIGSVQTETNAFVYQVSDEALSGAKFDYTLKKDAELACQICESTIFHYGPPLWRLGITDHYHKFEAGGCERHEAADDIVKAASSHIIPVGTQFFRIRLNPKIDEKISTAEAFDPPPAYITKAPGRWDDADHPVLYVSDDIELCLHECRAVISDEIVVASILSRKDLKILDLTENIEINPETPFDDVNLFIDVMCKSRGKWLEYCREISRSALKSGYDGIRYTSYYAQAKQDCTSLNLAIFGRPIADERVMVQSVNRIRVTNMRYEFQFGPVVYSDTDMEAELSKTKEMIKKIIDKYNL